MMSSLYLAMTSFNPSFNRTHSSATRNVKSFVGPNTKKSARSSTRRS